MQQLLYQLRVIWACARKDVRSTLTEKVFLVTMTIIPVSYFFLLMLFILSADQAPTAVVMQENGPYAQMLYDAMANAHSFALRQTSAAEAERLIDSGSIVAVVTIPANFDSAIANDQPVDVGVRINNLDTDFTADIRRAVPLSITSFYAHARPQLVTVTSQENDLYAHDTGYVPYIGVSILVCGLIIGGTIQSGTSWAREWEGQTMKELLLSPASRWSLFLGKMLGSLLLAMAPAALVFLVLIGALGTWPVHWFEMLAYTLLTLLIFSTLGTLLGTVARQSRHVVTLCLGSLVPLFFVSGPLGPVTFSTRAIQVIASLSPASYAIAGEQHAFHDFTTNTLGLWNALILLGMALGGTVAAVLVLRSSTAGHAPFNKEHR